MSELEDNRVVDEWFRRYNARNPPVGGDLAGLTLYGNLLVEARCRTKTAHDHHAVFVRDGHAGGESVADAPAGGGCGLLDALVRLIPLPTLADLTLGPLWPDLWNTTGVLGRYLRGGRRC